MGVGEGFCILIAESEAPSEQESKAKDGNFFSAERNQLEVENGINIQVIRSYSYHRLQGRAPKLAV